MEHTANKKRYGILCKALLLFSKVKKYFLPHPRPLSITTEDFAMERGGRRECPADFSKVFTSAPLCDVRSGEGWQRRGEVKAA
ncbi:MAG TPA: hypothetical protein PKK94_28630, partial [Leptospiraceae bacterium]|nr:hypothetical protein [Leptospiraceae bacterium]